MSSLLQKLREKHLVKKEPKSQTNQLVASSDMREEDVMSHLWKALVMSALTMLTLLLFIMFPLIINFSNDFFFLIMLFYRNITVYSFFYISRLIAAINRKMFFPLLKWTRISPFGSSRITIPGNEMETNMEIESESQTVDWISTLLLFIMFQLLLNY